ncbi:MAG: DUF2089 domain-containing protein [Firmicutes bacterium]|nr:DUF2089 domain-containing protein [Bacillota bacterium]
MTEKQVLGQCPICGNSLSVTSLHCHECDTSVHGSFRLCKICQLSKRQQQFVEVFVASRGNIKEVERVLGISYPTVRSRLDEIIEALGHPPQRSSDSETEEVTTEARRQILEALDRGEIDATDAIRQLRSENGGSRR